MRAERTAEEFERVAADLRDIADVIEEVAQEMQSRGVRSISVHSTVQFTRDLPSLLGWAHKVAAEWRVQSAHRGNGRSKETDRRTDQQEAERPSDATES